MISILWRCGARVLARKLRPWALQWADHPTLGGLPGRGVLDAHIRIAAALEEDVEDQIFVSQDLTKFFDTIDLEQAAAVLKHLRAPPAIIALIQGFYRQTAESSLPKGSLDNLGRFVVEASCKSSLASPIFFGDTLQLLFQKL